MATDLQATCTGVTQILNLEYRAGMSQATATVELIASAHTLEVGDEVTVTMMGETMLTDGVVRKIIQRVPEMNYAISIQDSLCRALDYFIAPDNPASPYQAINIKAEDLVEDLLEMAGLVLTQKDATIFTYGTAGPVDIKLVSSWAMIEIINRITGFITYADEDGLIRFTQRKTYVTSSDTVSAHSFTSGSTLTEIEYERSTNNLLNRVVVYGGEGSTLFYTAQASSPYLPAGFYKTLVVGHPLIDNMAAATATGDINLEMFNRLTETCSVKVIGDATVKAREIVDVTDSFTGLTSATKWLVFDAMHTLGPNGYTTQLTLVR